MDVGLRIAPALGLMAALAAGDTQASVSLAQAVEILGNSVAFKTVEGEGRVAAYAAYLADVLKAGGFSASDIEIVPVDETATLMARYRGAGTKRPIVVAGHMDVVAARAEDWGRDPFKMTEDKRFYYGRGVEDNKFDVSMIVATLVRLKAEGFEPSRDIVLVLSGDEETTAASTQVLAEKIKGSELVLNGDAGGGTLGENGKAIVYGLQAAEKTYADIELTFSNPGGHSSLPRTDNAIYSAARAIDRIAAFSFPVQSNELTREFFRVTGARTPGTLGAAMRIFAANPLDAAAAATISQDPEFVGKIRTTCVATMIAGGHGRNALPQSVVVNINCRIFPGVSVEAVKATLAEAVADPEAKITLLGNPLASDASPLRADVTAAVRKAIDRRYRALPIVPEMSSGASDSAVFRAAGIPSYGVSSLFQKSSDEFSHGLNERVPKGAVEGALDQWHTLLTELAR
jgi:acetylornithine deacetylase/succinyl-diaminopimelate desuccinylase-like protein